MTSVVVPLLAAAHDMFQTYWPCYPHHMYPVRHGCNVTNTSKCIDPASLEITLFFLKLAYHKNFHSWYTIWETCPCIWWQFFHTLKACLQFKALDWIAPLRYVTNIYSLKPPRCTCFRRGDSNESAQCIFYLLGLKIVTKYLRLYNLWQMNFQHNSVCSPISLARYR